MTEARDLVFTNTDATPKTVRLTVTHASVPLVMAWYGAYYAGDRYTVTFDSQKVKKDHNGELVGNLP